MYLPLHLRGPPKTLRQNVFCHLLAYALALLVLSPSSVLQKCTMRCVAQVQRALEALGEGAEAELPSLFSITRQRLLCKIHPG